MLCLGYTRDDAEALAPSVMDIGPTLSFRLAAALRALKLDPDRVDWDHQPPLGLRERTPTGGYLPDELDPAGLVPMAPHEHDTKTNGTPPGQKVVTVANGDKHKIAKAKRLGALTAGNAPAKKFHWSTGRKLQSRGFEKRKGE